jgi:hydrogenase expression/formation protein HypD
MRRLDDALELAERHGVILATYGDMMRVPGSGRRSMLTARAAGADPHGLFDARRAGDRARQPGRQVVFMGIGFETTTPASAMAILAARREGWQFQRVLQPCADPARHGPCAGGAGHRSGAGGAARRLSGAEPCLDRDRRAAYRPLVARYGKPVVIAGFEPLDVMQSVLMLIRQVNEGAPRSRTSMPAW